MLMYVAIQENNGLKLMQTLDDHAASVTDAKFWDTASTLISISSDRTVLIRKAAHGEDGAIAYLLVRTITLKASPISFTNVPFDPGVLVVSTLDRQVQKFEMDSGRLIRSFKPSDPMTDDSVMLSSLQAMMIDTPDGRASLISAVSSSDRSIRLHDYDTGSLLALEHGQASVCAALFLQTQSSTAGPNKLISCGHDGTVIVYNVNVASTQDGDDPCDSPARTQTPNSMPPLRKTLTKSEVAEFQKALEKSQGDTLSPIRSPSPTRLRQKTSRYSLASRANHVSSANSIGDNVPSTRRRISQEHSPKNVSPQNTIKGSKSKLRPSLDHRRRSKSVANLNDLNVSANHLSEALRTFRNRLTSNTADKLDPDTRKELRTELELSMQAMHNVKEGTSNAPEIPEKPAGESFDVYLARMIDERLELQNEQKENASRESGMKHCSADANKAQAGAKE